MKEGLTKNMMFLPLVFMMGKVDFDSDTVVYSRLSYFIILAAYLSVNYFIFRKIKGTTDQRKIYVMPPNKPAAKPGSTDLTGGRIETTYREHEISTIRMQFKQTFIGMAITMGLHFNLGVKQVMLLQTFMIPVPASVFPDSNILLLTRRARVRQIYSATSCSASTSCSKPKNVSSMSFSKSTVSLFSLAFVFPRLTLPASLAACSEIAAGKALPKAAAPKAKAAAGKSANKGENATIKADTIIVEFWDAAAKASLASLKKVPKPNHQTKRDSWTALMVACGSPCNARVAIKAMVKNGADAMLQVGHVCKCCVLLHFTLHSLLCPFHSCRTGTGGLLCIGHVFTTGPNTPQRCLR